ncbi:hypothetical protein DQ04_00621020 [Trypanosoma grayi]|uniref:hypothetical protein n=1 Tax=Trypanosoma grayi TaxID=71804 RepID=UPI0004F4BB56|nr:hypothetical protein DQ04_00621020 [Trypanosoma grayi]KEG14093.1 hypothetical protein DQ04_00621020 [Trypanosoma grayi]
MLRVTPLSHARAVIKRRTPQLWGAPGAPIIRMRGHHVVWKFQSYDIVVEHTHKRHVSDVRLLHYLGKHCPHPQKSLWSPDTPVAQDRHLFMLTTVDVDAFKYWFGVKRCRLSTRPWTLLAKAGLLPPSLRENSKIMPKPLFDKEQLMRYYLANRKDEALIAREDYLNYQNSMVKSEEERAAERPVAPYL